MWNFVGNHSEESAARKFVDFRHNYLRSMREITYYSSPENSRSLQSSCSFSLPTFDKRRITVEVPLPLPNINGHWGVSALFSRIHAGDLILILKTLMIERSVLIIGECPDLVTSCACALRELLKPYEWASTFMPLLPSDMLDFVTSPVPFIIGMAAVDKDSCRAIENDERVLEASSTGLTCINLSTNTVRFTAESGVLDILKGCPTPK